MCFEEENNQLCSGRPVLKRQNSIFLIIHVIYSLLNIKPEHKCSPSPRDRRNPSFSNSWWSSLTSVHKNIPPKYLPSSASLPREEINQPQCLFPRIFLFAHLQLKLISGAASPSCRHNLHFPSKCVIWFGNYIYLPRVEVAQRLCLCEKIISLTNADWHVDVARENCRGHFHQLGITQ